MNTRWVWLGLVAVMSAGCERRGPPPEDETEGLLALSVETPEILDWGGTGALRLTLANEGDAAEPGAIIEVHIPSWLEFGAVEPAGTAVTIVSGDTETRLAYQLTDTLPPGERRTVVQHLRVPYQPPAAAPVNDTIPTIQLAPTNRVVRARLVSATGEPVGAEVQATLNFVGTSTPLPPPATPDTAAADTAARGRGRAPTPTP